MLPLIASCGGGSQACNGSGFAFGSLVGDLCKNSSSPNELQTTTSTQGQAAVLSGTAAAGSPIQGTVQVTDAQGSQQSAVIGADGFYSVNVLGMTGPFIVKALGTSACAPVTYYAGATAADVGGNVNVTPMTDLILSSIAGQGTNAHLSSQAALQKLAGDLTDIKLRQAQAALVLKLRPVLLALGVSEPVDLIKSVFKTDQSGLDALLDLVKVEADAAGGVVTLRNRITQDEMAVIPLGQPISSTPIAPNKTAGISAAAASDVHAIGEVFCQLDALFLRGSPTAASMNNIGIFDTSDSFLLGGESFTQFVESVTTDPDLVSLSFTNWSLVRFNTGVSATVLFKVGDRSGSDYSTSSEIFILNKNGDRWLITGDQQITNSELKNEHTLKLQVNNQWANTADPKVRNGIRFDIRSKAFNIRTRGPRIASAVITGSGLLEPLQLVTSSNDSDQMVITSSALMDGHVLRDCDSAEPDEIALTCLNLSAVNLSQPYTLVLWSETGQSLNGNGYKVLLDRLPLAFSALSSSKFVNVSSGTLNGNPLTALGFGPNGSVRVVLKVPNRVQVNSVKLMAWSNSDVVIERDYRVPLGDTQALITWGDMLRPGLVTRVSLRVVAYSDEGHKLVTEVAMNPP